MSTKNKVGCILIGNSSFGSLPMIFVYVLEKQIKVDEFGNVGITVVARFLRALNCNEISTINSTTYELNTNNIHNHNYHQYRMSSTCRRRYALKRIINRCNNNNRSYKKYYFNRMFRPDKFHPTPTSPINNLIVNHPTLKMSTTSSPLSDDSNVTRSPEISSLPNETINLSSLPYDADTHQCINWLRQNGCQYPESKLGSITASALRGYSRTDMIEIFGQIDGINLYNNLHPNPKKIYIGIKNNEVYSWKLLYFYNTTAQAFIMKVLITFNLTNIKFDSVWLEGPHKIRVLLENEHIKNMKNESTFIIQIDEDLENHRYNLILIPFHGDRRED